MGQLQDTASAVSVLLGSVLPVLAAEPVRHCNLSLGPRSGTRKISLDLHVLAHPTQHTALQLSLQCSEDPVLLCLHTCRSLPYNQLTGTLPSTWDQLQSLQVGTCGAPSSNNGSASEGTHSQLSALNLFPALAASDAPQQSTAVL